jgi:hypothetical protein
MVMVTAAMSRQKPGMSQKEKTKRKSGVRKQMLEKPIYAAEGYFRTPNILF